MSRRSNRPRRTASPRQIQVLQALGWRYSTTREAYVHRLGSGRRGPVFSHPGEATWGPGSDVDDELDAAIRHARTRQREEAFAGGGPLPRLVAPGAAPATAPDAAIARGTEAQPEVEPRETAAPIEDRDDAAPAPAPALARRTPRRPAAGRPSGPAPRPTPHEADLEIDGEVITVRVDGRPPQLPGRPRLSLADSGRDREASA